MRRLLVVLFAIAGPLVAQGTEGRFLYANDDDWDWASPADPAPGERCGLSRYGVMEWSALDWAEQGLDEVRGILLGTAPVGYLPAGGLSAVRGATYDVVAHRRGGLADALDGPNVVVMMCDRGGEFEVAFDDADRQAVVDFVTGGGRLVVLDDWGAYRAIVDWILAAARPAEAEGPIDDATRRRVEALVERLGSDDYGTREEATEALVALGRSILPLLSDVASDDPEVANRIAFVRRTLDPPIPAGTTGSASDDDIERLRATARRIDPGAEVRAIRRNAGGQPGRALVVRVRP